MEPSKKQRHLQRLKALRNERASWVSHWRDVIDNVRPHGARFEGELSNNGSPKHQAIINSKPTVAARTLAAGIMAGLTSPSRPWFRLTTPDRNIAEREDVKVWLSTVEQTLRDTITRSNLNRCLHSVYQDLGLPGVSVLWVEPDADITLRGFVLPIGSYCLATSDKGEVDTLYRETRMTVRALAKKFGADALSPGTRQLLEAHQFDTWVDVVHAVVHNEDFEAGKLGPRGKRWLSLWMEKGGDDDKLLRESGFDTKPFLAPRWEVTGEDVYGHSPGMDALGDCRALQHLERVKAKLGDKLADPPMRAPTQLQHRRMSLLPGDVTFVDAAGGQGTYEPAYVVPPQAMPAVSQEIMRHEERIEKAFYADLWLLLSQSDGNMTAREVVERREEKLLQLGTVVENLHGELLAPLIDIVFNECLVRGMLPPPPDDMQGSELKVEYISIMAQAQKLLGKTAIDSLVNFVGAVAAVKPDVVDKLDTDQLVDEYGNLLGVPPVVVRSDDAVEALRAARQEAAAQQQAIEQAQQVGNAAKAMSGAKLDDKNALSEMLRSMGAR